MSTEQTQKIINDERQQIKLHLKIIMILYVIKKSDSKNNKCFNYLTTELNTNYILARIICINTFTAEFFQNM